MKKYSFIMAIFLATGIAAVAYASILFTGILTVSNSGTTASEVCTTFSINASYLQDVYDVDDEFDNVKILNSSGENVTFQPGYGTNPWCIFVPEIGEYTTAGYEFYTGNASLDGKKAIFLDDSMTITDDASMECGDNFTMTFTDYYISGNQTWASKTNAYSLATASGNITFSVTGGDSVTAPITDGEHDISISSVNYSISQPLNESYYSATGFHLKIGQKVPSFYGNIESISLYLKKFGTPTGTANVTVRDTSMNVIGILGTIDISTLTTDFAEYSFANLVSVSSNQTILIFIECPSMVLGDIVQLQASQLSSFNGNVVRSTDGSSYEDYLSYDLTINIQNYYGLISIDGNETVSLASLIYPDAANDLVIYAPYYLGSYNINVDGTDVCTIPWSYGATLEDQSGNGNDATPTFRTTSSDADVSAELTEYLPYAEADAEAVPIGYGTIFDEAPEQPETAYSENTSPGIFFAPALNAIIDITPIPRSFFWYNFAFCIIILSGMVTWRIHQSLILKAIVMTAFMILFALPGINIYGMYTVIYFSFFNFGLIVMSRSYGL